MKRVSGYFATSGGFYQAVWVKLTLAIIIILATSCQLGVCGLCRDGVHDGSGSNCAWPRIIDGTVELIYISSDPIGEANFHQFQGHLKTYNVGVNVSVTVD